MKKFLLGIIGSIVLGCMGISYASDPASILQVNVYTYDQVHEVFTLVQQGSAVVLDSQTALTNAHVVSDELGNTYYYELCQTVQLNRPPVCFGAGTLKKMRQEHDLAVLKFNSNDSLVPVSLQPQTPQLGDDVTVLGYPSNGGKTITQTQGKVSGFDEQFIKTDANIDAGNSGGGAFDSDGRLIGVPTQVVIGYTTLGYIVPVEYIYELLYNTSDYQSPEQTYAYTQFEQYLKIFHALQQNGLLDSPQYRFQGWSTAGFEVDAYLGSDQSQPLYALFSSRSDETTISIDTYQFSNIELIRRINKDLEKTYADEFDIYKTKTINIKNQNRKITFAGLDDGYIFLDFVLLDEEFGLSYTIQSIDDDESDVVEAIILFLNNLDVTGSKAVGYTDTVEEFLDLLGIQEIIAADSYGYDIYGDAIHSIVLQDGSSTYYEMDYQLHAYDDEFGQYTYDDFREIVSGLVSEYSSAYGSQSGMQESFLIQNTHGLVRVMVPVSYDRDGEVFTTYTISTLLQQSPGGDIYQYTLSMPWYEDENTEEIIEFIQNIAPRNGATHPFESLGVDEDSIEEISLSSFGQ